MDQNTLDSDQEFSGPTTNQNILVADTQVTEQSVNQSNTGSEIDVIQQYSDQTSDTDSQKTDDSFVVLSRDECVDSDNNSSNPDIVSLGTELKYDGQTTSKDGEYLKSEESKGGTKEEQEISIGEKLDHNITLDERSQGVESAPAKLENNEESTVSEKNIQSMGEKKPTDSEDKYLCKDSLEDTEQIALKSTVDNSRYAGMEGTEEIHSRTNETDFDSEEKECNDAGILDEQKERKDEVTEFANVCCKGQAKVCSVLPDDEKELKNGVDSDSSEKEVQLSVIHKTTECQPKNTSEPHEQKHSTRSGDFKNLETIDSTNSENIELNDAAKETANTSGQQCNDAGILDEQKAGKDEVTEFAKTDGRSPTKVCNVYPNDEKVLEKKSMATDSTTSKPNLENFTNDEKLLEVTGTFGVIKLLKVSKFWFIALNGQKSKVPEPAFQDSSIRLEEYGEEILLVTDSHCYRVRIKEDKLILKVFSSYFSKPAAEKYDRKVNYGSQKFSKNDTKEAKQMENRNENEAERENEKQRLASLTEVKEINNSFENTRSDLAKEETPDENEVVHGTAENRLLDGNCSKDAFMLPMQDESNTGIKTSTANKNDLQKGKEVEKVHSQTTRQVQLLDSKSKDVVPKQGDIQGKVKGARSGEFPDTKKMVYKQAEAGLEPEESKTGANRHDNHEEKLVRSPQSHKAEDQERPTEKSPSEAEAKNKGEDESFKTEDNDHQWQNKTYVQQNEAHSEGVNESDDISDSNYQNNRETETNSAPKTPLKSDDDDESAVDDLIKQMHSTHITDTDEQGPCLSSNSPKQKQLHPEERKNSEKPNGFDQDLQIDKVKGLYQDLQTNKVKGIYPDITNLAEEDTTQWGKREDTSTGKQMNKDQKLGNHPSRMASKVFELPKNFPWKRLLQKFDTLSHLKQLLQSLKIETLYKGQIFSIKFTGIERDTEYAIKFVQDEAVARVCREQVFLSFESMAVFKHTHICEMLEQSLNGSVLVFEENQNLCVCSFDKEACRTAKLKICNLVAERTIPLTGNWRTEAGFKILTDKISFDQECMYVSRNINFTSITITGLKTKVEELDRDITNILQDKANQTERNKAELIPMKKNNCELKYFLDPCDVWLKLSEKFRIEENLRQIAPSADVQLTKVERGNRHICVLVIAGREEQAEAAVQKFKSEYRDNLFRKEVPVKHRDAEAITNTDICNMLNRKFTKVLLIMENGNLVCYTFDKHAANETSEQICRMITKESIMLQGAWKKKELMKYLQEEIIRTYESVYVVLDYDCFLLTITGIRDSVARATQQMVSKMKTDPQVSHLHEIENKETFQVLMKDTKFLTYLRKKFEVEIIPDVMEQILEIKGISANVDNCRSEIELYCKSVISESKEEIVQNSEYVASKSFQNLLDQVGEHNQVIIERSLTNKQESGILFQDERSDRKCFLFPSGQKLILINPNTAESGSNFIVKVSEGSHNAAGYKRQYLKSQTIFEMDYPRHNGRGDVQRAQEIIKKILTIAREDKKKVVDFKVPLLTTWSTENMIDCWIPVIYEYFMESDGGQNPQSIILGPFCFNYQYFVDCCKIYIDKINSGAEPFKSTRQPRFKISVVPGKLNETKADILVNTASHDLDLMKGAVSSALLQTAGPELQAEVNRNHPSDLSSGELVITKGHKLRCYYVFHGALPLYDSQDVEKSRKQLNLFMKKCLFKANNYSARSIAFPAIGAGNLRYPIKLVVTEMFDAVNDFEQNGYPTSLKEVCFVIYRGDTTAVDAFTKRAEEEKNLAEAAGYSRDSSRNQKQSVRLHLTITGHKENVAKARQMIDADVFGEGQASSTGSRSKTYSEAVQTNSFKGSLEASSQASRPTGSSTNTATEHEISGRLNSIPVVGPVTCTTSDGLIVRVYTADILHLPVDCIVNAADEKLSNTTGLARNIAEAAGYELVTDCQNAITYGSISAGSAVRTKAGKLKYKFVIHTVGPVWYQHSPYAEPDVTACQQRLRKAIISSLNIAEQSRMGTMAIPSISAGSFGVPKELCAMEYAKAVMEFSSTRTYHSKSLKEVHFVDIDPNMASLIKEAFTQMIKYRNKGPWDWRMYVHSEQRAAATRPKTQHQYQSEFSTVPQFMENGDSLTCKFTQTFVVSISKDDIFKFKKMDALVCSEDLYGTATGGVAKLLLQRAGKQYEKEKKQKYNELKPKTGDVLITKGGHSGFSWIIHAIMPHRTHFVTATNNVDEQRWVHALGEMIDNVLETAYKNGYQTVVMSLLGTGAGYSDPKQCADVLLDRLTLSCTRHPDSVLHLHVVNNDVRRNQVVKDTFKRHMIATKQLLGGAVSKDSNRRTNWPQSTSV